MEVTENHDIYVTYHVTTQQNEVLNTTNFGYGGFGPGWGTWGVGGLSTATTPVSTYTEGTLIIDAYRASDKKLIWRRSFVGLRARWPVARLSPPRAFLP